MRLIEKKCPNCGTPIGFGESDTSCECRFCHKIYIIKRDALNITDYNLEEQEEKKKTNYWLLILIAVIVLIIGLVVFKLLTN